MAGRRNIMRKFRIGEISGVDYPCQAEARAVIFKRGEPLAGEGETAVSIKKSLGLAESATEAEVTAAIEKRDADAAALTAQVADLAKRATLSDETRGHLEALEKAGKKEDAKAFLDKDEAGRKAEVALAKVGDETFTTSDGGVISKRAVGDAAFAVMKSQETRLQAQADQIAKAAEATALAGFTKAATTDFAHLAGSVEERASVLKFLDGAPADVKKAADAILKAAEGASKFAFEKAGHGGGRTPEREDAETTLQKMADELRKADPNLTPAQAYDKALASPEGAAAYEKSLSRPVQE
jgi:hypothetical protein